MDVKLIVATIKPNVLEVCRLRGEMYDAVKPTVVIKSSADFVNFRPFRFVGRDKPVKL